MQESALPLLSPASSAMTPEGSHFQEAFTGGKTARTWCDEHEATLFMPIFIIAQRNRRGAAYGKKNQPRSHAKTL